MLDETTSENTSPQKTTARRGRLLNEKEVIEIVRISRSTIYRMGKAGKFPEPTRPTTNRKFWFEEDIWDWLSTVNEFDPKRRRGKGRRPAPRK
ncbi:helix-turn-helix transcriptional regulator [Bradyrhizobium japonicum]|uniref:helix-turn-helix transcriptional regulator n=1 Tax=Bradyrhizobium japonicum TaxID=375 RepID=UPI001BABEAEF|nr:AlpA family phage regulatory protein [Bradyrhizobium japonicum]MBR0916522.1 AlpA family phage regulatory protein [Bradyrhizobium japonicum]